MKNGKFDIFVSLGAYHDRDNLTPVCEIGSSEFFFALKKSDHDLMAQLNYAMNSILAENPLYNHELNLKYIHHSSINRDLSAEEKRWLSEHKTIKIGYQDNYLAFCAKDKKTGKLTGVLKDYLEMSADVFRDYHLNFEPIAYPTSEAALNALSKGEIDCMFPANLSEYDGEVKGVFITSSLIRSEMIAVVSESQKESFTKKERVTVAVNTGNPNYDMFLYDNFPSWQALYFEDTPECLLAISEGKADCLIISHFRFNNIAKLCERYNLTTVSTGVELDYCFAVNRKDTALYSILTKLNGSVSTTAINVALSNYTAEDAKPGLLDFLKKYMGVEVTIITSVLMLIVFLALHSARAQRKAQTNRKLIIATQIDELTGLYNRNYFFEYAEQRYRKNPEKQMDAIAVNIEQFHSINAINGRQFGDKVLGELGYEISAFLRGNGGIAGRIEADYFVIYCKHLQDFHTLLDRLQVVMDRISSNDSIQLRMGVMPWQEDMEPQQMFEHALTACNLARGKYNSRLVVFDEKIRERQNFEQRLTKDVYRALENNEFEVYFQPKYDIKSDTPRLAGAEALVRWKHPELGMIPPLDFIPLFEKNGQIILIDKYVWKKAIEEVARLRDRFGVSIPISINLSRLEIFEPTLETTLNNLLEENGLTPNDIDLEITESVYMENTEQFIEIVERLQEKGYKIEMDDFGSGYSSLGMLSSMPVNFLKMDSSFIRNIEHSEKDFRLVKLILEVAENLQVPVVAEGVETEEQYKLLKQVGCDIVQGYYFSCPLPAEDFERDIVEKSIAD